MRTPRPDWTDAESYGFDPRTLPYRVYAWEFLRRNLRYQNESGEAFKSGSQRKREEVATKYGLRDLIPYKDAYFPEEGKAFWLAEALTEPAFVHRKGKPNVVHTQRPGEVALVFDLDATVTSGPAAVDAFLWGARKMLMEERMRYIQALPPSDRVVRLNSPSIRKAKLFTWLRTYDAIEHEGVSQKEAAKILHPEDFVPDKFTKKTKELAAQKKVSDDRKRAMTLVDNEYLALVPLEYLQDKSKR